MRLEDIQERVEQIKDLCQEGDDEQCHGLEDDLYVDFVKYIANSIVDEKLSEMAKAILKTRDFNFDRYCS